MSLFVFKITQLFLLLFMPKTLNMLCQAQSLQADVADFAISGSAEDDVVAELLNRISSISLRAEEESVSGLLSVKDLVANIPPIQSLTSHNSHLKSRAFNVGLHSPSSALSESASSASNDIPGSRERSSAVISSVAMLVDQVM